MRDERFLAVGRERVSIASKQVQQERILFEFNVIIKFSMLT